MQLPVMCIVLLLGSVSCRRRDSKRKSETEKYRTLPNVCDNDNRESPFVCTCDKTSVNSASTAQCWVLPLAAEIPAPPWSHFATQANLQEVKLSCRKQAIVSVFPSEMFSIAPKIEVFEMMYGSLREIFGYSMNNASHLRDVALPRNEIFMLHPNAFAYLNSLETVNLEDNALVELQPMVFHHLPNLRKLFLSRNNLSIIHDNAFRFLNHLLDLEMGSNQISILTRETFNGLFRLLRLDLNNNKLTMLGDNTFAEMSNLRELDLESNALEFLADGAFNGLKFLTRLRISRNKLKSLSEHIFMQNPGIQFLDLRDNDMELLKFNTLEPLWENFKNLSTHLLLEGNQFPCDCHLSWVYSLRNETPNKQIVSSLEELACVLPDNFVTNDETVGSVEQQDDHFVDNGVEYDGVEYEELPEEDGPPMKKIVDIPPADLPCPESLVVTTESPLLQHADLPVAEGAFGSGYRTSCQIFVPVVFLVLLFLT